MRKMSFFDPFNISHFKPYFKIMSDIDAFCHKSNFNRYKYGHEIAKATINAIYQMMCLLSIFTSHVTMTY